MASGHVYSRILRTVGQALEKRHIDLFDLRCYQNEFFLQCGDPTPPHLSLVELRYTLADLDDLDLDARDNRAGSFKLVDFEGLPEILRALGHRVEKGTPVIADLQFRIVQLRRINPVGISDPRRRTAYGRTPYGVRGRLRYAHV